MEILILAFLILVLFHFIYEYIIAPTLRRNLSFKLFKLRDELRNLAIESEDNINKEVYTYLQNTINNTIKFVDILDFRILYNMKEIIEHDGKLQKMIKKYNEMFEKNATDEMRYIRERKLFVVKEIILVNTFGMFVYIIPIIFLCVMYDKIKLWISTFASVPDTPVSNEKVIKNLVPSH